MNVSDAVISRCQDLDENVRLEVFTMVQGLAKRKFEALNERLLTHVIHRIRDRKVRNDLASKIFLVDESLYALCLCNVLWIKTDVQPQNLFKIN